MKAATGGRSLDAVVERVNRLATDCGELTIELVAYAIAKIEELFGMPRDQLFELVLSTDSNSITDPADKRLLQAIQALDDPDSIHAVLNDLIPPSRDSPDQLEDKTRDGVEQRNTPTRESG